MVAMYQPRLIIALLLLLGIVEERLDLGARREPPSQVIVILVVVGEAAAAIEYVENDTNQRRGWQNERG